MISVQDIIPNTDYLLFRAGIRPEWEDEQNKHGGKWVATFPVEDHMEEECEFSWINLVGNRS
jgi:translation initiation factor 4E